MTELTVQVDSLLRFYERDVPAWFVKAVKRKFTYENPEYIKMQRIGRSPFGMSKTVSTAEFVDGVVRLWRGSAAKLREVAKESEVDLRWHDRRLVLPEIEIPAGGLTARENQVPVIEAMLRKEQGIVRGGTGVGKTETALLAAIATKQPTLVVVWNSGLFKQWVARIERHEILPAKKVGLIGKGKRTLGPITIGMVQTLAKPETIAEVRKLFGTVILDECQRCPATTYAKAINAFPARYRFGLTADETRRDGMEFKCYDAFGGVIGKIESNETTVEPTIYVVPTDHMDSEFYEDDNWTRFIDRLMAAVERRRLVERYLRAQLEEGRKVLLFTERREDAIAWARAVRAWGYKSVCLVGSAKNKVESEWVEAATLAAERGEVDFASATSFGDVGLDLRGMDTAFIYVPIQKNPKRLEQMIGRIVRPFEGKTEARVFYFWDRWVTNIGRKEGWTSFGHSEIRKKWNKRVTIVDEADRL